MEEVALRIGSSEASSSVHAFRRRKGTSPGPWIRAGPCRCRPLRTGSEVESVHRCQAPAVMVHAVASITVDREVLCH